MGPIHAQDQAFLHVGNNYYQSEDRCLADLRCTDPRDDKIRIEDTKGGLLRDSYRWVLDNAEFQRWRDDEYSRLLWIKGDPGKGKTMLLCGILDELTPSTKLAGHSNGAVLSYFFCQATDSRINSATAVLRGLIYLIVKQQPSLLSHVQNRYNDANKELFSDANAWAALSSIFINILSALHQQVTYLVIDALDECVQDLSRLLDLIVKNLAFPHIKWVVSSRNVPDIERKLRQDRSQSRLNLELKENADQVTIAVSSYIEHHVSELLDLQDDINLQARVQDTMQRKANGTFLWVSLVIEELKSAESWEVDQILNELPSGLEDLYNRMLDQIRRLKREKPRLCQLALSAATIAYAPLHLLELGIVSGLSEQVSGGPQSIESIVRLCGSFLTIRKEYVFIVHQSAKDFLLKKASHIVFPSGIDSMHYTIFQQSLQIMSKTLRRDVYNLCAPGYPIEQVKQPGPDPLAAARYSCVYWIDHLHDCRASENAKNQLQGSDGLTSFLNEKFLYWLEALSLLKRMANGMRSMTKLETLFEVR